jgi:hypothetical protein
MLERHEERLALGFQFRKGVPELCAGVRRKRLAERSFNRGIDELNGLTHNG